ncbi:MAG: hypothetical protein HY078_12685 [Elusimicrobia bacterium]|nr:hypothetical protein [Elusimicrobiota bacterium]
MKRKAAVLGGLGLMVALQTVAYASRVINCSGKKDAVPVKVSILSNQNFGDILQATLEYGSVRAAFAATDAGTTGRVVVNAEDGSATIPFGTGEKIILFPGEKSVSVFDKRGALVGQFGCG